MITADSSPPFLLSLKIPWFSSWLLSTTSCMAWETASHMADIYRSWSESCLGFPVSFGILPFLGLVSNPVYGYITFYYFLQMFRLNGKFTSKKTNNKTEKGNCDEETSNEFHFFVGYRITPSAGQQLNLPRRHAWSETYPWISLGNEGCILQKSRRFPSQFTRRKKYDSHVDTAKFKRMKSMR